MTTAPAGSIDSGTGPPPPMSVPALQLNVNRPPRRLLRYRLGLALYFASVFMMFVGFSSAYVVRRGVVTYEPGMAAYSANWEALGLPIALLLLNTMLLCLASVSIEIARRRELANRRMKSAHQAAIGTWVVSSLLLGLGFVMGQLAVWRHLRIQGQFLTTGARTAFFYVFTGVHGVHALIGLALLAWLAMRLRKLHSAARYMALDLTAWYLHAMAALWIGVFGFLMLA